MAGYSDWGVGWGQDAVMEGQDTMTGGEQDTVTSGGRMQCPGGGVRTQRRVGGQDAVAWGSGHSTGWWGEGRRQDTVARGDTVVWGVRTQCQG